MLQSSFIARASIAVAYAEEKIRRMEYNWTSCLNLLPSSLHTRALTLLWLWSGFFNSAAKVLTGHPVSAGNLFHLMSRRSRLALVKLTFENRAISVFASRLLVRERGAAGQVALHRSNMEKICREF